MKYIAHSARPDQNISAQEYGEHVRASRDLARRFAEECGHYSPIYGKTLVAAAMLSGEYHDLGKLDDANQTVLSGAGAGRLPVPHVDAGAAHLIGRHDQAYKYAALVCYAHHRGLPSLPAEINRSDKWMRDASAQRRSHTDMHLDEYLRRHHACLEAVEFQSPQPLQTNQLQLFWRLTLSCQADADHGDTSRHYGEPPLTVSPSLKAQERLAALDDYVARLRDEDSSSRRTVLRQAIYEACRGANTRPRLYACDAPVGSGKTTAVMAHLLKAAHDKKLRRIFIVLPFTNIITQAVEVYRKAFVLPGENPEEIVAEHHHKADYAKPDSRRFAALWRAPIVVTTAVQFFETLASNMPADLRKLHCVPGSAIFFDEAHAALPAHLWPQAWLWLNELSQHWGAHCVFASGSLTRFWELPDFHPTGSPEQSKPPILPELVGDASRARAHGREDIRIAYHTKSQPLDLNTLIEWVGNHDEGPRLLVMNTVQSAAVVAREMAKQFGRECVEHISTALTPTDRALTLHHAKKRLTQEADRNWTLVATSCMEAGVDLSFRIGFRERASLMSLIQLGGRVNRGHTLDSAQVWDFQISADNLLRLHPKLKTAGRVLGSLFNEGKVSAEHCKEALRREVRWDNLLTDEILKAESTENARNTDFPKVAECFRVIDNNTVTVVVESNLQQQLRAGKWYGREQLQKHSVQIWGWRVGELRLEEFSRFPGVFGWPFTYDNFLGFMAGLLPIIEFADGKPTVI